MIAMSGADDELTSEELSFRCLNPHQRQEAMARRNAGESLATSRVRKRRRHHDWKAAAGNRKQNVGTRSWGYLVTCSGWSTPVSDRKLSAADT
jgi:hypothetical protein